MTHGGPEGHPVVGLRITLVDGKYHSVDSSEAAFETAASMGLRSALEEAGSIVLERIMLVRAAVPSEHLGEVLNDFSVRRGRVIGTIRSTIRWWLSRPTFPRPNCTATGSTCATSPRVGAESRWNRITSRKRPRPSRRDRRDFSCPGRWFGRATPWTMRPTPRSPVIGSHDLRHRGCPSSEMMRKGGHSVTPVCHRSRRLRAVVFRRDLGDS